MTRTIPYRTTFLPFSRTYRQLSMKFLPHIHRIHRTGIRFLLRHFTSAETFLNSVGMTQELSA